MWRQIGNSADSGLLRQDAKCDICKQERRRRCGVLRQVDAEDVRKFQAPPFTTASYVHPFRHPSHHATQLRALHLAKMQNRRVLWCVAFGQVKGDSLRENASEVEKRKERWLEFHDRATGGIPGLLPLVLDMPVRFTETIDKRSRLFGVFKYARGILRGWQLAETEVTRIGVLLA